MKKILVLSAFLFLLVPVWGKTVVLYHTGDTHGFFYPQKQVGGYAALAALLKQEKNPYLLLDSGDFASGTAETEKTKGLAAVALMNAVGYDAATLGNHEFDFKDEGINSLLQQANFAVLAANLREKKTDKLPTWTKAYEIFDVGGIQVAVIGLANRYPSQASTQYYFTKPLPVFAAALTEIEKERPAVVVVLAHDTLADDREGRYSYLGDIAAKYGGRVHVILGGHTHQIFQNKFFNGVLYAQSGCHLKNVTKVTVDIDDKTGKIKHFSSQLIPLNIAQTGSDKSIEKLANSFRDDSLEQIVGQAGEKFSQNPVRSGEKDSPLDDWISDLGRQYTKTDIFIHNTGATRTSLEKGPVTKRTLIDLFPFEDTMVSLEIPGSVLKKFIRRGLTPHNKYIYSGLQISYALTRAGRVKKLEVLLNGKAIENQAVYRVGTNTYVAKQVLLKELEKCSSGEKTVRQLMLEALEKGPVFPPNTGRVILK